MRRYKHFIFTTLLVFTTIATIYAEIDLSKLIVNTAPVKNSHTMVQQSDLIVLGSPDDAVKKYPTKKTVDQFKIVNYVQTFHTQKGLKGSFPSLVKIVSVGIEPLPNPSNPINRLYPGPLAKENYILFLKKVPQSEYYTIIGGWQGVYPLFEGKIISFEGLGFKEFSGLTVNQLEQKIKELAG